MAIQTQVVILNWNGKYYLEKFLSGTIQNSPGAEIIVADNASTDDSLIFLERNFPNIRIIALPKNLGYAGGYNEVLSRLEANYYVLLNNDIEVSPGWLEPLIDLMKRDQSIVACQPKILSYNHREYFEYAGAAGGFIDKFSYPFCRGRIFHHLEKDQSQYYDTCQIFWASGACLVVRADIFTLFGGFDEKFFAHMEEIDLCWRLNNAGYKIFYCGESHVYHVGAGTLSQKNPFKTYLNFRNSLLMMYKNLPSDKLHFTIFIRMLLDGISGVYFMFKGEFTNTLAIIRAHFYFYFNFYKWKKNKNKSVFTKLIYSGSIVIDFFIKGKKKFLELKW